MFLHKTLYIPPSFRKKNWHSLSQFFLKQPRFTTFSLFLKVSEVLCQTSSKCWLPNKSADKNILTRDTLHASFISKKGHSPSQMLLKTSTFHSIFTSFHSGWAMKYYKYHSSISKKNWRSPSQEFFETSTFYPIFIIFNSEWGL